MRIGINGFGRIGRLALRIALERDPGLEIVAINTRGNADINAYLFRYDSTYSPYQGHVEVHDDVMRVDGRAIRLTSFVNPLEIPWADLGVDLVVESTGVFAKAELAAAHLQSGAKRVLVTAPSQGADVTIVMGVNHDEYDPGRHTIISAASCTTNCLAPVVKVLYEAFGIEAGTMCTIHAYTNDQQILDKSHRDPRRSRAAAANIVPTTTGAAKALRLVLPAVGDRIQGVSYRVPTLTVSMIDLVVNLARPADGAAELNAALRRAARGSLFGILNVSDEQLVSTDFKGSSYSATVDGPMTSVVPGSQLAHVVAWYDNEWGYASRIVNLARLIVDRQDGLHDFSPRGRMVAAAEIHRRLLLGELGP
ncbi:MAG: type I glyceraldehyde-3-phosphate dehydrogenase [Ardenticatenaceae bacterium]|nr:type I glyceraldehyde-3-phosphate dehydrogenase [Ardenticatenaceae bacterium]